jgi:hypothetical protein
MWLRIGVAGLWLAGSLWLAGCPSCPYESKCEGDVLKTCSVGVDQVVGSPQRSARACRAPNPVCVTLNEDRAQCAMEAEPGCGAAFAGYCADGLRIECSAGYRVAEDCAAHGNTCFELDDGPRCAREPLTVCNPPDIDSRCEGDVLIACVYGYLKAEDCSLAPEPEVCTPFQNDYGRGAYCEPP